MGGHGKSNDHGHDGHHGDHGHHDHHHAPYVEKSVIPYHIPEPGHHTEDFVSPDWRLFRVENAPALVSVRDRLAQKGLKDPWLRNEAWRFDPQFGAVAPRTQMLRAAGTGMKLGLALAIGTILLETGYNKVFNKGGDHHHGHGHH